MLYIASNGKRRKRQKSNHHLELTFSHHIVKLSMIHSVPETQFFDEMYAMWKRGCSGMHKMLVAIMCSIHVALYNLKSDAQIDQRE